MAAVAVLMAVVAVAGFGVGVLVLYRLKVRELRRNPVPGVKVRMSGRDLASLGLLISGVWVFVCVGAALTVYADVWPYVFAGMLVFVLVLLRPVIQARGRSAFVLKQPEGAVMKPAEPLVSGRGRRRAGVAVDGVNSTDETPSVTYTEHELRLGATANRVFLSLSVLVLILGLGIAVFVLSVLPLDTRLAYSGRLGRNGIPMPIAVAVMPLAVFFTLRPLLKPKPDANHMDKGGRMIIYWIGVPMLLLFLYGQWIIAESMLSDAGLLAWDSE